MSYQLTVVYILFIANWMKGLTKMLFCLLQGLSSRQIRFRFDGQPINETDTPAQVGESWTQSPEYEELY